MRAAKTVLSILLCAVLLLSTGYSVKAAEGNNSTYTYTVRILAGKQGSIDIPEVVTVDNKDAVITCSGDMVVISNLKYGDNIRFDREKVTKSNANKYYVKGFRESGKDSGELASPDFIVTEDRDYVVAYGLAKNLIPYVVHYQDAGGNTLAESETYYGTVNEKPIVPYKYIDGYQPEAYNLTKTLVGDPAKDVFTFTYTPVPPGTVVTRFTTVVLPGTFTDLGTEVTDEGVVPGPGGEVPGPGGEENPGGELEITEQDLPLAEAEEVKDLDIKDDKVPLASPLSLLDSMRRVVFENAFLMSIPMPVKICCLLLFLLLVALGVGHIVKNNKRKKA